MKSLQYQYNIYPLYDRAEFKILISIAYGMIRYEHLQVELAEA